MKINVKCFASLSNDDTCRHDQPISITIGEDNATIGNLIDHVRVPEKEIATVFVNGRRVGRDGRLADGDRVAFVPAVGGV
ncbi:MoaD/ThiS family protein [uncultured Desulfosarcina sp.]|uniref:MoaD/ThiS family protein n=1 Tax=uncultured Desulfosarcina sp. TaxID=218289 RepID=UPI0029C82C41|nr:MoaD/ThiS family protein [uncultured Desulfosarcina sp.]